MVRWAFLFAIVVEVDPLSSSIVFVWRLVSKRVPRPLISWSFQKGLLVVLMCSFGALV